MAHAVTQFPRNFLTFTGDGSGLTNVQPALQAAATLAAAQGQPLYIPSGTYLLAASGSQIALANLTQDFEMFGDGLLTRFRRGDNTCTADFSKMFRFRNNPGSQVKIHIHHLQIDDNARGNPLTVAALSITANRWQASNAYLADDMAYNDTGKLYRCTAGGMSAASGGPTGSAMNNIADNGVTWRSVGAWLPATGYLIGDFATSGANLYFYSKAGTSHASVGPSGASTTEVADGAAGVKYSQQFVYEHSHVFAVDPVGTRGILEAKFDNVVVFDPVADSFSAGGNAVDTIGEMSGDRLYEYGRTRVRSSFTCTASFDSLILSNSNLKVFETEPNAIAADSKCEIKISNTVLDGIDVICPMISSPASLVNVTVNERMSWFDHKLVAVGCHFNLNSFFRLGRTVGQTDIRHKFIGCAFSATKYWRDTNQILIGVSSAATRPQDIEFNDCDFSSTASTQIHFWEDDNQVLPGSIKKFLNNRIYGSPTVDYFALYRRGRYEFVNNRFDGVFAGGHAILQGDTSGSDNFTVLYNNIVTTAGIYLWRPTTTSSGAVVDIWMQGNVHLTDGLGRLINFSSFGNIAAPKGTGSVLLFHDLDRADVDVIPTTGKFIRGFNVRFSDPAANLTGAMGAVCTKSGTDSAATWKLINPAYLTGSASWDPAPILAGGMEAKNITVTGAALGDFVALSFSLDVVDLTLSGTVTAANVVTGVLANATGSAVNLAGGTIRAVVTPKAAYGF
jgi:hypothetical protein